MLYSLFVYIIHYLYIYSGKFFGMNMY